MKKLLSVLVALFMIALITPMASAAVSVDGHICAGLDTVEGKTTKDELEFGMVKANVNVNASAGDVSARVEIRTDVDKDKINIRQAYAQVAGLAPNLALRIGKLRAPIMGGLRPLDYADNMSNILVSGAMGGYATAMDTGMAAIYKVSDQVTGTVALTNGINADKDKAITLKVATKNLAPNLTLDISYQSLKDNSDMEVYGSYNLADMGLKVSAIYATGEVSKAKRDYMGAEACYTVAGTPLSVAARYTVTDPKGDNNNTNQMQVGVNYKVSDNAKIQVEYITSEVDDKVKNDSDTSGINLLVAAAF
ncbi:MAG: porin [bacterium]|nr:porin [bacterium]